MINGGETMEQWSNNGEKQWLTGDFMVNEWLEKWHFLGKFDHDRSLFSRSLESWFNKGDHPKMAQHFRLVNYYHLPRIIYHT